LDRARPDLEAAEAAVVVVFAYSGPQAAGFCAERGLELECLGDPDGEAYAAVGLGRAPLLEFLRPDVVAGAVQALRSGARFGEPRGADITQRGGLFVVGRDGRVEFAHAGSHLGDLGDVDAVRAVVRGLSAR